MFIISLDVFAIWVLIALCISIYSNSAIRASINVFAFFIGMVASYYLYSNYIAGFFPRSYAVIWFGFTAVSPLLSFLPAGMQGEKQTGTYTIGADFGSIVQYVLCIWMLVF